MTTADISLSPSHDQVLTSASAVADTTLPLKLVILLIVIALALVYASYGDRFTPSQIHWIGGSFVGLVIAGMLVVWFLSRTRARRRLRLEPSLPLAQRVWLSGRAHQWFASFDVKLWIDQTGLRGPRVINTGPTLVPIAADPQSHEEMDLAAELAQTLRRSKLVWWTLAVLTFGLAVSLGPFIAIARLTAIRVEQLLFGPVIYVVILFSTLYSFNWLPLLRRVIIVAPGRVDLTSLGRTLAFTREDSVILLTPNIGIRWGYVHFLRADGKHASITLSASNAPALNALLARWSYAPLTSATADRTPGPS